MNDFPGASEIINNLIAKYVCILMVNPLYLLKATYREVMTYGNQSDEDTSVKNRLGEIL